MKDLARLALVRHPATPCRCVREMAAEVDVLNNGALAIEYSVEGDIAGLVIPSPGAPHRTDGLWQHSCFEAFLQVEGQAEYCEFNFSPSGQWAAYAFGRYREGGPLEGGGLAPESIVRSNGERFELDAVIRLDHMSSLKTCMRLRMGLAAVIEERNGALSYWALRHPAGKPDFHHPESFALNLALDETREP
jgi:hypothetical protein